MRSPTPDLDRRNFVRQGCCAALGTTGLLSAMAQLKLVGAIAADSANRHRAAAVEADYRALVCLFLSGGNDGHNVLIPYDTASHARYASSRADLAIPRDQILPIGARRYSDGRNYGLNRDVAEIKALYDQGKVAMLGNVGTLVRPTTLADYKASIALPHQLYSHLDQSVQWQSSLPDQSSFRTGWGGRMADLIDSMNVNNQISMSISVGNRNYFQVGQAVSAYVANSGGAEILSGYSASGSNSRYNSLKRIMDGRFDNILASSFAAATREAIQDSEYLSTSLTRAPTLATSFASNSTAQKLRMVARLISIASSMGLKRQVFFVDIGGYDNHGQQATAHPALLRELSTAMKSFYDATVELGVANQVTTFTASDFGRTYIPNSGGTDHGWGNIQFVMGGAVQGGDIYGTMPSLVVNGPDDTGRGRWIPSTSVDEYNATLATWFGVSAANLPVVLPNIGRFAKPNLGFMA
jgi:uncharacterized protein (DUF1501 family)